MKKLLGISLVAILASTPLMASAATGDPVATGTTPAHADEAVAATAEPGFALAVEATTDNNAASAGYVKGAYNAAIKAVNKVHAEAVAAKTAADAAVYTEGPGIDITNKKVSVDLTANGGLETTGTGDAATLGVKTDGATIVKDSSGALKVKDNVFLTSHQDISGKVNTSDLANKSLDIDANSLKVNGAAVLTSHQDISGKVNTSDLANKSLDIDAKTLKVNGAAVLTSHQSLTDYAKKTGVVATIKNTKLTQGAVTQGLTGSVSGTSGTIVEIMTKWGDDTVKVAKTGITAVSNGTLATNVSVAAPTINATTVSYSETVAQ